MTRCDVYLHWRRFMSLVFAKQWVWKENIAYQVLLAVPLFTKFKLNKQSALFHATLLEKLLPWRWEKKEDAKGHFYQYWFFIFIFAQLKINYTLIMWYIYAKSYFFGLFCIKMPTERKYLWRQEPFLEEIVRIRIFRGIGHCRLLWQAVRYNNKITLVVLLFTTAKKGIYFEYSSWKNAGEQLAWFIFMQKQWICGVCWHDEKP